MNHTISKELIHFIESSPSCFHAVNFMEDLLLKEQFIQLRENEKWRIQRGGRYFVRAQWFLLLLLSLFRNQDFPGHAHNGQPQRLASSFKIKEIRSWNRRIITYV